MATNSLTTSDMNIVAEQSAQQTYQTTITLNYVDLSPSYNGGNTKYVVTSNEPLYIFYGSRTGNDIYPYFFIGTINDLKNFSTYDYQDKCVVSSILSFPNGSTSLGNDLPANMCLNRSGRTICTLSASCPIFDSKTTLQNYLETGDESGWLNKPTSPPTPTITLATPSLMAIGVFDPAEPYDIRFIYTGSQSVKNRVVITDPDTYEVVYDKTVLTMKLLHTIPAGILKTNKCYTAAVQVFDADDNKSNLSESTLFYCYTKPVFSISEVPTVCKGASITLPLSYLQPEGETLKSYQFFMCDSNHNILNRSDTFYTDEHMSYSFSGLQNHYTYCFRAIGETTHGYKLDTGYLTVAVDYNVVPTNAVLVLENVYRRGYISIKTNIKSIGYELKNDNYFFEGDTVTLYGDNYVKYNEGFSLDGDFSLFVEAKKLPLGTFLRTENDTFTLSIVQVCDTYYCEFRADDYVLYCPLPKAGVSTTKDDYLVAADGTVFEIVNLDYDDDDFIVFEVKRTNSVCSLHAYHKSYALQN